VVVEDQHFYGKSPLPGAGSFFIRGLATVRER
jgi:hypothetical protein